MFSHKVRIFSGIGQREFRLPKNLKVGLYFTQCSQLRHHMNRSTRTAHWLTPNASRPERTAEGLSRPRGEQKSIQTDRLVLVLGPPEKVEAVRSIYRLFTDEGLPKIVAE